MTKVSQIKCSRLKSYSIDLISNPCPLCPNGKFIDIKRHCHNIIRFFNSEHPYDGNPSADWFQLASGITDVRYVSDMFNDEIISCGPGIDYEHSKSKFHSILITELTRFSFIWSGLESILNDYKLPKYVGGQDGKIKRLNYFLTKHYLEKHPIPKGYIETVEFLKLLLGYTEGNESPSFFIADKNCSQEIVGIKAVYKIRNLFAHGSLKFNEPEEYHYSKKNGLVRPLDIDIIQTSSRIVLLTLQMLLTLLPTNLNFIVTKQHEYLSGRGINALLFLQNMHLKDFEKKSRYV